MAVLTIITKEDETLRKKSKAVDEITPKIITLLDDMHDTLAKAGGVGLAAVQVGILRRIYIIDDGLENGESHMVEFINPEIIRTEGTQQDIEGCLSVPGEYGETIRPAVVTVRAQNRAGETFEYTSQTPLMARCLCHEYDHLDGVLYTDNVVRMCDPDEIESSDAEEESPKKSLRRHKRKKK